MMRPPLGEIVPLPVQFVAYAVVLMATRATAPPATASMPRRVGCLVIVPLVAMIASLPVLGQLSRAPLDSTIKPEHVENGTLVPGAMR